MKIVVSGTGKEVPNGLTVAGLIQLEQVQTPQYVTVSINGKFIRSDAFAAQTLEDGDSVEFIYFMGGGEAWR